MARFHAETLKSLAELLAACGIASPAQITARQVSHRLAGGAIVTLAALYPVPPKRAFLMGLAAPELQALWNQASSQSFHRLALNVPPTLVSETTD